MCHVGLFLCLALLIVVGLSIVLILVLQDFLVLCFDVACAM